MVALLIVGIILVCLGLSLKSHQELVRWAEEDEEQEREKKVRALYPPPLTYEERTGDRYGPKRDE
jgi:hypothetical protein